MQASIECYVYKAFCCFLRSYITLWFFFSNRFLLISIQFLSIRNIGARELIWRLLIRIYSLLSPLSKGMPSPNRSFKWRKYFSSSCFWIYTCFIWPISGFSKLFSLDSMVGTSLAIGVFLRTGIFLWKEPLSRKAQSYENCALELPSYLRWMCTFVPFVTASS